MTDKFMSNWGCAENKINKLVLECKDMKEANIVYKNAVEHTDMSRVNICQNKPNYDDSKILTSFKTIKEYPAWYEWGFGR